jgi:LmbE family N-acetylglucosaminyl deacetylase
MSNYLFVQPHPDDLELNCGQILHYLSKKAKNINKIQIISVTKGEFGLPGPQYDKFKGKFLAKVRERELQNAMAIHGIPPTNIYYFGYIDGYVPFNREIIDKFIKFLSKNRPNIIFAPEPLYTNYVHNDHINSGRAIYYILYHHIIKEYSPKLYFYSSLWPNYYFPFKKEDYKVTESLLACHKTQFWLLNRMKIFIKIMARWYGLVVPGWKFAESFRRVNFNLFNSSIMNEKIPINVRLFYRFYWAHKSWYDAKYPLNEVEL